MVHGIGGNQLPLYPPLISSIPSLLETLTPHILRTHMTTAQFKPIPNNERVDLAGFRVKETVEWTADDVLAWMLDVAKTNSIPFEEFNMHRFANFDGKQLMRLSEHHFIELDPSYGQLLFREFRKLLIVTSEDTVIDDAMRRFRESDDSPSTPHITVTNVGGMGMGSPEQLAATNHALQAGIAQTTALLNAQTQLQQDLQQKINERFQHNLHQQTMQQNITGLQIAQSLAAANNLANLSNLSNNISLQQMHAALSPQSPLNQPRISPLPPNQELINKYVHHQPSTSNDYDSEDESRITRNKDGKPRKRSQHTKGNKLWEFIRDALKDPTTCPSIVRWEDPMEGVFRIVESEKLARLWGERKNNHKMTYEKLSRAMRTYYEKQILVPVPKTGLYPKKLVYKFGPGAHGWEIKKENG